MTIDDILSALSAKADDLKGVYGTGNLSAGENTNVTDELAKVLETVNPNHDYPPVPKS